MRKTFHAIICLLTVTFLLSSCLKDNTTTYELTSDALITNFSINDIKTAIPSKTTEGKDTTLYVTITGSNYKFLIDQKGGLVHNIDSLPVGTDITHVTCNMNITGYAVTYQKNDKDTIWTNTDSLDFTTPVNFKVYAMDGTPRAYKIQINVHKLVPDSLQWSKVEQTNYPVNGEAYPKAVTFGKQTLVFSQGEDGMAVTMSANGLQWSDLQPIEGIAATVTSDEMASIINFKETLYLVASQQLHTSKDGIHWNTIDTNLKISKLIAASATAIYAYTPEQCIAESSDGATWTLDSTPASELVNFPDSELSYTVCPTKTNSNIERLVVVGNTTQHSDSTALVWSKLSTENQWVRYETSRDNLFGCPNLEHLTAIHYDGKIYAFGGNRRGTKSASVKPFDAIYESIDHGLTWKATEKLVKLPTVFANRTQPFACIVDSEQYIWVMWNGDANNAPEVWKGRINRLGFSKAQ